METHRHPRSPLAYPFEVLSYLREGCGSPEIVDRMTRYRVGAKAAPIPQYVSRRRSDHHGSRRRTVSRVLRDIQSTGESHIRAFGEWIQSEKQVTIVKSSSFSG